MPERPKCPECEYQLTCTNCDRPKDDRPKAEKLYAGWVLRTPFDRWETIERVEQVVNYGPVRIWTKETGPGFAWSYNRWTQVDARPPLRHDRHGTPEVRIIDGGRGYTRMYAIAILDTANYGWVPKSPSVLVEAASAGHGKGWWVVNQAGAEYTESGYPAEKYEGLTKDQARSKLIRLGRAHAKALKVKFTLPAKE